MTGLPTEPITVTSRTQSGTDEYGDPTYTTTTLTRDGLFAPAIGFEQTSGQDQVTSQPHVYFTGQDAIDVRAVISSTSELTIRGKTGYQVDGEVADWGDAGLDVPLQRTVG